MKPTKEHEEYKSLLIKLATALDDSKAAYGTKATAIGASLGAEMAEECLKDAKTSKEAKEMFDRMVAAFAKFFKETAAEAFEGCLDGYESDKDTPKKPKPK